MDKASPSVPSCGAVSAVLASPDYLGADALIAANLMVLEIPHASPLVREAAINSLCAIRDNPAHDDTTRNARARDPSQN